MYGAIVGIFVASNFCMKYNFIVPAFTLSVNNKDIILNAVQKFESAFVHTVLYKINDRTGLMHDKTEYIQDSIGLIHNRKG